MAIDEPRYAVVRSYDAFEVRRYEGYLVAETTVRAAAEEAGNQGFRALAAYIFGGNKGARKIEMTAPVAQSSVKIAMTAPVTQTASDDASVIQFAMPSEWTLETLPEPLDPMVSVRAMPARTLAVIGYSGTCLCVDPVAGFWSVVLTNRVYNCQGQLCPQGSEDAVKGLYRKFNTAAAAHAAAARKRGL